MCHINVFYYIERIFFCLVALFFYFYNFFCYHASIITITYYLSIHTVFWQTVRAAMFSRCSDNVFRLAIISEHVAVVSRQGECPVSAFITYQAILSGVLLSTLSVSFLIPDTVSMLLSVLSFPPVLEALPFYLPALLR